MLRSLKEREKGEGILARYGERQREKGEGILARYGERQGMGKGKVWGKARYGGLR